MAKMVVGACTCVHDVRVSCACVCRVRMFWDRYVEKHPGGDKILRDAGGDASGPFRGPQHPTHVFETVERFCIGVVKK